jgi:hypothetical protein
MKGYRHVQEKGKKSSMRAALITQEEDMKSDWADSEMDFLFRTCSILE